MCGLHEPIEQGTVSFHYVTSVHAIISSVSTNLCDVVLKSWKSGLYGMTWLISVGREANYADLCRSLSSDSSRFIPLYSPFAPVVSHAHTHKNTKYQFLTVN